MTDRTEIGAQKQKGLIEMNNLIVKQHFYLHNMNMRIQLLCSDST